MGSLPFFALNIQYFNIALLVIPLSIFKGNFTSFRKNVEESLELSKNILIFAHRRLYAYVRQSPDNRKTTVIPSVPQ